MKSKKLYLLIVVGILCYSLKAASTCTNIDYGPQTNDEQSYEFGECGFAQTRADPEYGADD